MRIPWSEEWFARLAGEYKLLWCYLIHASNARKEVGIGLEELRVAIGYPYTAEGILGALGRRIEVSNVGEARMPTEDPRQLEMFPAWSRAELARRIEARMRRRHAA